MCKPLFRNNVTYVCFISYFVSCQFWQRSYQNQLSFSGKDSTTDFFVFGHFDKNTKNEKWNEPDFKGEILLQKHFESILTRISAPLSFAQQNFSLASFLLTRKKGGKRVFYWLLHYVLTPYTSMYISNYYSRSLVFGRVVVPQRLINLSLYHEILLLQKFNNISGKVLKPKKFSLQPQKKTRPCMIVSDCVWW